jgi:acyl-[acyl-carrier-protein]-phospholipid O-acyltransferase/long-chain-fatty-acid--[acyl-carrier-protein] ligase
MNSTNFTASLIEKRSTSKVTNKSHKRFSGALVVRFFMLIIAKIFFRIKIVGAQNAPKGGALLVVNHVSFLDSMLIISAVPRMIRFVMLKKIYAMKLLNWAFKRLHLIPITGNVNPEELEQFNRRCQEEINKGHVVCIFPEGQITNGELLEFKKGIEYIVKGIDAPVIPMYMHNVVGCPFSYKPGTKKLFGFSLFRLRRKVTLVLDKPMSSASTAAEVRARIVELSKQV